MEKIKIMPVIVALQKRLIDQPYDLAHDITHHARVYKLTKQIVKKESLSVDEDLLSVAAWSHDLFGREGNKTQELMQFLLNNGCSAAFAERVVKLVEEHSFGRAQSSIEAQILYDADKLEYVSPDRLNGFLLASKRRLISVETTLGYRKQWQERIYKIPGLLHFSWSKKEFARLLPAAEKIMGNKI